MSRHYSDYFTVPIGYRANMTREFINETPDKWLDFYPHEKYLRFIDTLMDAIREGSKSVWLTGNYGTGKSNAALVTQKLYMDESKRVDAWFDHYSSVIDKYSPGLKANLDKQRNDGTLVIYDYNASGLDPDGEFIVRLEKSIIQALKDSNLIIPINSDTELVKERIRREGERFLQTKESIQTELKYIPSEINSIDALIKLLDDDSKDSLEAVHYLEDIQTILHHDNIFLSVDVPHFKEWISKIIEVNNLTRIIFIFDEFSNFIDDNKSRLKTFEEIAENPGVYNFYFVPVTHMGLNAFLSDNSSSAQRCKNRFYFRQLEMPNDIAFRLAADALKEVPELHDEWEEIKSKLWADIQQVVLKFSTDDINHKSFRDILPIHPMAGFLLKLLSGSIGADQRSIFEYLKGSADGHEFQDFIKTGGPEEFGKQLLTPDYLWKYFIEKEEEGEKKDVMDIRLYYNKIRNSTYRGKTDDDPSIRVFKTILLLVLLSKINKDGHERLQPTIENVELCYVGDGSVQNIKKIIKGLEDQHCLSVLNGNIELYMSTTDDANIKQEMEKYLPKFNELMAKKAEEALLKHAKTSSFNGNPPGRFVVHVSDKDHTSLQFFSTAAKEEVGKETGKICIWFSISKTHDDLKEIPEKIKRILEQTKTEFRIILINFPEITFCNKNSENWNEYVRLFVRYQLENDSSARSQFQKGMEKMETEWLDQMQTPIVKFTAYQWKNNEIDIKECTWSSFKQYLTESVRMMLPDSIDHIAPIMTAYGITAFKKWALSGIDFQKATKECKQVVIYIQKNGITSDDDWYNQNPNHPFTHIHELLKKKMDNTIGRGTNFSVRKAFIDLRKSPYGLMDNAFSALTLGFCLKDILENNYQCTDEKITETLDEDLLGSIIEDAIKSDGKIRNEKLICKLSKEDKAFIELAPKMFGIQNNGTNLTTNETISVISNKITNISLRVPLWVLPDYIDSKEDEKKESIRKVIEDLCLVCRTSSKGNVAERSEAIREIGSILLGDKELTNDIEKYMQSEEFQSAFEEYIDREYPILNSKAQKIGDNSKRYLSSILDKMAVASSFIWIKDNLDDNVNETITEYEVVEMLKEIVSPDEYISYRQTIDSLQESIFNKNKVPKGTLITDYPSLADFLNCLESLSKTQNTKAALEIKNTIFESLKLIKLLFYDPKKKESLKIIRKEFETKDIEDSVLLAILNEMSNGYNSIESAFRKELEEKIDKYEKESYVHRLYSIWKEKTDTENPSEWSINNKMPAKYALNDCIDAASIIQIINNSADYSLSKMKETYDTLSNLEKTQIEKSQKQFLFDITPERFRTLNLSFGNIVLFLCEQYGEMPNMWPDKIDISKYISRYYRAEIAPKAMEKIKETNSEELKEMILKMAEENEDIGLLFWK